MVVCAAERGRGVVTEAEVWSVWSWKQAIRTFQQGLDFNDQLKCIWFSFSFVYV